MFFCDKKIDTIAQMLGEGSLQISVTTVVRQGRLFNFHSGLHFVVFSLYSFPALWAFPFTTELSQFANFYFVMLFFKLGVMDSQMFACFDDSISFNVKQR